MEPAGATPHTLKDMAIEAQNPTPTAAGTAQWFSVHSWAHAVLVAAPLDKQALGAALAALGELLDNHDMAATDAMEQLRQQFGPALGQALQPLDDALSRLDFAAAAQQSAQLHQEVCP
jgi:hypothetical protein